MGAARPFPPFGQTAMCQGGLWTYDPELAVSGMAALGAKLRKVGGRRITHE